MNRLQANTKTSHLGTGRPAAVQRVENFESPVSIDAGCYVLVIGSEKVPVFLGIETARAWIDAGASYVPRTQLAR